jgi:hypothetical protein
MVEVSLLGRPSSVELDYTQLMGFEAHVRAAVPDGMGRSAAAS